MRGIQLYEAVRTKLDENQSTRYKILLLATFSNYARNLIQTRENLSVANF
jgi:hypothetical protein